LHQRDSHSTDFTEFSYWEAVRKSVEKLQILGKIKQNYSALYTRRPKKVTGKVQHWGTSTPQPQGLLYSHPERVASFISRGAAHRTVCSASASEGTM
jgi:hypothetical protein